MMCLAKAWAYVSPFSLKSNVSAITAINFPDSFILANFCNFSPFRSSQNLLEVPVLWILVVLVVLIIYSYLIEFLHPLNPKFIIDDFICVQRL